MIDTTYLAAAFLLIAQLSVTLFAVRWLTSSEARRQEAEAEAKP